MASNEFGGRWTSEKLEILGRYLDAYTTALKNQPFDLVYVDAFAGSGTWSPPPEYELDVYDDGDYQDLRKGSAAIALDVEDKPFDRFVFIEKDPARAYSLQELSANHPRRRAISVINDDANFVLPNFCRNMTESERAVVFLDPFKTEVDWDTVEAIAKTEKIDCWILFPFMAVSRMMARGSEPSGAISEDFDRIFGGRDFWSGLYSASPQLSMFDADPTMERRGGGEEIARRYRARLEAAFARVAPTNRVLVNSRNAPLFNLFFAAGNRRGAAVAIRIADHILKNW